MVRFSYCDRVCFLLLSKQFPSGGLSMSSIESCYLSKWGLSVYLPMIDKVGGGGTY